MGSASPATLVDASDCTFELNATNQGGAATAAELNVQVVYSSFNAEVLDLDPNDGFVVPDPAQPLRFKLAHNLCESNYKQGKILAVSASPGCASKRALQPICSSDLTAIQAGELSPVAGGPLSECSVPDKLSPSPSALYVLADRSNSMQGFYGADGLAVALETTLDNPIAARTQVGFGFVPSDNPASECSANNSYATPSIEFGTVADVRDSIAAVLADGNNVLSSNPDLYLDAAMRSDSAYQTLRNLTPSGGSAEFNRRALLIVGNRDFTGGCGGDTPADLAAAAFGASNDKIHTYTVVLESDGTVSGAPVSDAAAIASAGGTTGYDATAAPEEGASAIAEIIADLGSCLYDAPNATTLDTPSELDEVTVSYLDPITLERTNAVFNSSCSEGATVDGWNVTDNGGIRICGAPCDHLRTVLGDVASYAAAQQAPAPEVPVVAFTACGS